MHIHVPVRARTISIQYPLLNKPKKYTANAGLIFTLGRTPESRFTRTQESLFIRMYENSLAEEHLYYYFYHYAIIIITIIKFLGEKN